MGRTELSGLQPFSDYYPAKKGVEDLRFPLCMTSATFMVLLPLRPPQHEASEIRDAAGHRLHIVMSFDDSDE